MYRFMIPALLYAFFFGNSVTATVVVGMDIEAMADQATEIVQGRVENIHTVNEGGRFVTVVRIHVNRAWKGRTQSDAFVEIALPGGQVGSLAQRVAGTPQFQVGDRIVTFLWSDEKTGPYRLLGLSQGLFQIEDGASGLVAVSRRSGLMRMEGSSREPQEAPMVSLPLSEVIQRVSIRVEERKSSRVLSTETVK